MLLYGVCNHSIADFIRWKPKKRCQHITSFSNVEKGKTLLITDSALIINNLRSANKLNNTCVLFTGPLRLASLKGIHYLDLTFEHSPPFYGIKMRSELNDDIWQSGTDTKVVLSPIDYTQSIINHVESTSILTDFMTIIYTLPSATHQKPIKTVLLNWIYHSKKTSSLTALLTKVSETLPLSARSVDKIQTLLLSPIGLRIKKALMESKKGDLEKAAHDNAVSAYDMRYILSIVKDASHTDFEKRLIEKIKRNEL